MHLDKSEFSVSLGSCNRQYEVIFCIRMTFILTHQRLRIVNVTPFSYEILCTLPRLPTRAAPITHHFQQCLSLDKQKCALRTLDCGKARRQGKISSLIDQDLIRSRKSAYILANASFHKESHNRKSGLINLYPSPSDSLLPCRRVASLNCSLPL